MKFKSPFQAFLKMKFVIKKSRTPARSEKNVAALSSPLAERTTFFQNSNSQKNIKKNNVHFNASRNSKIKIKNDAIKKTMKKETHGQEQNPKKSCKEQKQNETKKSNQESLLEQTRATTTQCVLRNANMK